MKLFGWRGFALVFAMHAFWIFYFLNNWEFETSRAPLLEWTAFGAMALLASVFIAGPCSYLIMYLADIFKFVIQGKIRFFEFSIWFILFGIFTVVSYFGFQMLFRDQQYFFIPFEWDIYLFLFGSTFLILCVWGGWQYFAFKQYMKSIKQDYLRKIELGEIDPALGSKIIERFNQLGY